jgi:hypothetical protein
MEYEVTCNFKTGYYKSAMIIVAQNRTLGGKVMFYIHIRDWNI